MTAAALAAGLRAVTTDDAMRRRAGELGMRVRAEDGVRQAVRVFDGVTVRPR